MELSTYKKFQKPYEDGKGIFLRLLLGLSTHKYKECIKLVSQAFGLSVSNLSSKFKEFAERALRQLQTMRLDNYDFICIFIEEKKISERRDNCAGGCNDRGK